jgi:hypothetical protein
MLKQVGAMLKWGGQEKWVGQKKWGGQEEIKPSVSISKADFPAPFSSGLEFSAPARGIWTIVHVGMLVPKAHEIFVCAAGCLRGVVLSAAEMNLTGRFSTVAIEEHNVLEGDMEELIVEGVTDILNRLPKLPPAVLVYSSCIHHFMGCDLEMCYNTLRERFPSVDFTDCYMIPTMRKSGQTPDQIMRRQLYSLLRPTEKKAKVCSIIGNCFSLEESSDLVRLIHRAGFTLYQLPDMKTYGQYQKMSESVFCISTQPVAKAAGDALEGRLGQTHLYLPLCYSAEEIRNNLSMLAQRLGISYDGDKLWEATAKKALNIASKIIGKTAIVIDYTFTPRPLGLARLLISYGFKVKTLYLDTFNGEERSDLLWLQENAPDLEICPTVHPAMRRVERSSEEKVLALGQKAAYFTNTRYFVNLVEGGSLYGFDGIRRLSELMIEAFKEEKDAEMLIQCKGLGCESCI